MRRALLILAVVTGIGQLAGGQVPLVLLRTIELPAVEGRLDHLSADVDQNRLFVAALGNNSVEVVDLRSGMHVKSLRGFREPQGVAVIPDQRAIVVANGQAGNATVIDSATLQPSKIIPLSDDADNVRYDEPGRRVYVGHGNGALTAIEAGTWRVLGSVRLSGHPESFQLESSGPRIFVNVPTANHIAVVDRTAMKVVTTWPSSGAQSNFPMALDEASHLLFVGFRRPAKVLMYDTESGRQAGSIDVCGDTDDLFYDARRQRLYVSCGEGFVDVFDHARGRLTRMAHVATAAGARTSLFVAEQSRLYVAVPHRGRQRSEIRVYEAQ
jgi:DNA-binding beta-propeller fold protein YncE